MVKRVDSALVKQMERFSKNDSYDYNPSLLRVRLESLQLCREVSRYRKGSHPNQSFRGSDRG